MAWVLSPSWSAWPRCSLQVCWTTRVPCIPYLPARRSVPCRRRTRALKSRPQPRLQSPLRVKRLVLSEEPVPARRGHIRLNWLDSAVVQNRMDKCIAIRSSRMVRNLLFLDLCHLEQEAGVRPLSDDIRIEAWDRVSATVPAACLRPGEGSDWPCGHFGYSTFCTSTPMGRNGVPSIVRLVWIGIRQGFVMVLGAGHVRVDDPEMITKKSQMPVEKPGRAYVDPALVGRRARRGRRRKQRELGGEGIGCAVPRCHLAGYGDSVFPRSRIGVVCQGNVTLRRIGNGEI